MDERKFLFAYDRRRTSTLTLDEQPGAHAGATRQYIPGYSSSNIVYLNTASGNDSNDGSTELLAKLTYASAATAAGSTKKIQGINDGLALSTNITKPTEMKRGVSGTISGSLTTPIDTFTQSGTLNGISGSVNGTIWVPWLSKWFAAGGSSKLYSSTDGDTWTAVAGHSFGSDYPTCLYADIKTKTIIAGGINGKIAIAVNGDSFTQVTTPFSTSDNVIGIAGDNAGAIVAVTSGAGLIAKSTDAGETWETIPRFIDIGRVFGGVAYGNGKWVFCDVGEFTWVSTDLLTFTKSSDAPGTNAFRNVFYSEIAGLFLLANEENSVGYTSDGLTISTTAVASLESYGFAESIELGKIVLVGANGAMYYSTNGTSWTAVSTPSFSASDIASIAFSPLLGKFAAVGASKAAISTAYQYTISANIAGFTVRAMQYSGTGTAYNCTLRQPGTTAALTLDGCRVNYDSHISNNAAKSRATLYIGDRHTTCTPATQNDIDMNLDTVGGTWYIYNASQTGYERIRDCIVEGGIVASYPVTVSGRANTRGTSENVLFGATVTHNDPKFVDETDYALQYQTNGYDKNSPMAGRSAIYFNSSGGARDIGAWSYIESAVSYYYAKSRYLYKGQDISHGLEFNLTEQQGDSGVMNVYGNTQRIKEVLTMQYGSTQEEERAVFYEMLTLKDKGVKITFAEWEDNTGTVTANGNQSSGAEFLTVDAVQVFNGMTVTIAGKVYSVMRASPNMTAATKLILDRPTTDAVSDNDVLTTNYPSGQGEYQFSGPTNITMKQNAATGLTGWRTGFAIRLIRKYQG